MMSEETLPPRAKSPVSFTLVLVLVVGAAVLFFLLMRAGLLNPNAARITTHGKIPPITAQGWLNTESATGPDLKGKVYLVEAWATWCVPCRLKAPEMVRLYEKYKPRGVEFVGLTAEDASELPAIQQFLSSTGITWPNGYGATDTLAALDAQYIPAIWIVGADGTIVWNHDRAVSMEAALDYALAAVEE